MILGVLDDLLERPPIQKFGLLLGVLIAVTVLDWQYWYGPGIERMTQLRVDVADRRADLEMKQSRTNARDAAEREVHDLAAELRRAQARLPDEREIADLLSNIASSGRGAGLEITLFRQKPETYKSFYAEVPVQMEMRGTYHEVAAFLDRVKRLDRIVNVTDITFKKPRVQGDEMLLDAGCTVTTFRFLDEEERQRIADEAKKKDDKKPGGAKAALPKGKGA